jgi:hypothetical protein
MRAPVSLASAALLLSTLLACAPEAIAPGKSSASKPRTGSEAAGSGGKASSNADSDTPSAAEPTAKPGRAVGVAGSAPPPVPAAAPAAPAAPSPAPAAFVAATAVASLKRWPVDAPAANGGGNGGGSAGAAGVPAAGSGGQVCIPIERGRRDRRLPMAGGLAVCGLPEGVLAGRGGDDRDPIPPPVGAAGAAGSGGSAGAAGASAGSGASVVTGTAVFTMTADGVNLGVALEDCALQKSYPVRIQAGTNCQGATSAGSRWDPPRGEGIPDVKCDALTASANYLRVNSDDKPWTIGPPDASNVVERAVVIYDPDDPLKAVACGVVTPL